MLALVIAGILAACLVVPVLTVLAGGFRVDGEFTLRYLFGVFRNPVYMEGIRNSLGIAAGATVLTLLLSLPPAWLAQRYDFPGRGLFSALILVPMILPPFVGAIGILQILGPYGALNAALGLGPVDWLGKGRAAGVCLLQALALYPIMYLNLSAALANIDPSMHEAAENLGCHGMRKFLRITLPLMLPGLFAGATLVFIAAFTELGAPLIMNYNRCAAVQIYDEIKDIGNSPFPYALVSVVLGISVLIYTGMRLWIGRGGSAMLSKSSGAYQARRLHGLPALAVALPFVLTTALALAPHLGVLLTSLSAPGTWYRSVLPDVFTLEHYREALGHGMTLSGIRNSLVFSTLAVGVNLALGLSIAWIATRTRLRGRGVLDTLAMLPLAVPGLVMAFGYLAISSRLSNLSVVRALPELRTLLDVQRNPSLFLVIAYAVRRLPFMVRAASAGLRQTSESLEESAANLGASPFRVIRRITLPLIAANLLAGLLLVFAFSMLEVSDSLILAQRADFYPITKTIFELFQLIGAGKYLASALGVWAMGFLAVTIIGCSLMLGRRLGALFRA